MIRVTSLRTCLAFSCVLLPCVIGCGGNKEETAKNDAGAKAAMERGAAPTTDKGQTFQAPPAPPP